MEAMNATNKRTMKTTNQTETTATKPAKPSAHTPTPWTIHVTGGETSGLIFGDGGCYQVADTGNAHFHNMIARPNGDTNVPLCRSMLAKCEANAALIVRAVNSFAELSAKAEAHAELVEALEDSNGVLDSINREVGGKSVAVRAVLEKVRSALAKAQATQS